MGQILENINLTINPACELVVKDATNMSDRNDHISIEFLKDVDGNIVSMIDEIKDYNTAVKDIHVYLFPKDGTFTYYKFYIPKLDHFLKEDNVYHIERELFVYNNKFYFGKANTDDVNNIIGSSVEVYYDQLWHYFDFAQDTFGYQKILFTVCKLQNCLVSLQKRILDNPNICDECSIDPSTRYRRDFLLSSLYVFDYLKDNAKYEEAQRILENIAGCGIYLCEDIIDSKSDCGCGKITY